MAAKRPKEHRLQDFLLTRIESFRKPNYTPQYNLVLRDIADHFNWKDGYAWPSAPTIARRTWISVGQVRTIIKALESDGLLAVLRREQKSSHYQFPTLPTSPHADLYEKPLSQAVAPPHERGGVPLLDGRASPIEGSVTPYSESSRTVNEPSIHSNHEAQPQREPYRAADGTVLDFPSGGEAQQNSRSSDADAAAFAQASIASLNKFFPSSPVSVRDLEDFAKEHQMSHREFQKMLLWAVTKSNGPWETLLASKSGPVVELGRMRGQFDAYFSYTGGMSLLEEKACHKILAAKRGKLCVALPEASPLQIPSAFIEDDIDYAAFDSSEDELD